MISSDLADHTQNEDFKKIVDIQKSNAVINKEQI
jgi:hypothetical protein